MRCSTSVSEPLLGRLGASVAAKPNWVAGAKAANEIARRAELCSQSEL